MPKSYKNPKVTSREEFAFKISVLRQKGFLSTAINNYINLTF